MKLLGEGGGASTSLRSTNQMLRVALLFYVHGKHLKSCRDGQLT